VLQEYLADTDREHFVILMLDQKNQVIGINTVSIGSLTASVVHPREVYKPAILSNCAALILGHNHPSGDPGQAHLKVAWLFRYSGQGISPPRALVTVGECLMGMRVPSSFHDSFAPLTDPRCPDAPKRQHLLMDILVLAVCAVIGGAAGWEDIEEYGKAQAAWFADLLDWPHGIPGHDTLRRVLSRLAPEELTQGFIAWTQALSEASGGEIISIDGKTLRHSFDQATATAAIHRVSAWASANRLVLGQLKVDEKSNESTAIPKRLPLLDVQGAVVTIDAMGCQCVFR
jgi:predicted transposase YbfD/YdcC